MQVHGEELEFIWHDPTIHITACCLQWNAALCRKDSDGDGLTNGQELGDPDCVWTKGQLPQRITDITHPGMESFFQSYVVVHMAKVLKSIFVDFEISLDQT